MAEAAGLSPRSVAKKIDRVKWLAQLTKQGKVSRSIASETESKWGGVVEAHVPYIAIEDLPKVLAKLPSGAVLNLVRKSVDSKPVVISHQGFVVREGGVVELKHASSGGNIRSMALTDYLRGLIHAESKDWPIIGINLNQVM